MFLLFWLGWRGLVAGSRIPKFLMRWNLLVKIFYDGGVAICPAKRKIGAWAAMVKAEGGILIEDPATAGVKESLG